MKKNISSTAILSAEIASDLKELEKFVHHPKHYTQGKIECITFIEDQKMGFHLGNAIKYIVRAPFKEKTKQDIQKAIWYLERYLTTL